jgi:FtsP/CotA-like multicopper oxidase with cupredoxin domain
MNSARLLHGFLMPLFFAAAQLASIRARAAVQCPGDSNGDAIPDDPDPLHPDAVCLHLSAGDGFADMADGRPLYTFGFADVTGISPESVMSYGTLRAGSPAPTITLKQGQEFYLSLTNVGMMMRPDLFDPHTVHFHGFPNASAIFDGVPDATISINMGGTLTYYYNIVEPGTYMYHCHVEATEHMQMGMLGNLYVLAAQNELPTGTDLDGFTHQTGYKYVYNDDDGSTYYDVEYPIQMGSFDPDFHDASEGIQPLPFANMQDTYALLNGRGYPDTTVPGDIGGSTTGIPAQTVSSLITANVGQKVLLRISNLSVTNFYTLTALGLPMRVVGSGARMLRGPDPDGIGPLLGKDVAYDTTSVTLGGGEAVDVIIDTAGIAPGTYFLYTTNLNYLSNGDEDFGGMMTEIELSALP